MISYVINYDMYKIGIVEDEPGIVSLYKFYLDKKYKDKLEVTYTADNGRDGIEKNQNSPADIIILCDRVGVTNSVDVAEKINACQPETIFIFTPFPPAEGDAPFSIDKNISHIKNFYIMTKPSPLKLLSEILDNAIKEIEQ
jgi:response regulator RpfG family c-di-GMP phosphodiesterase